MAKAPPTTQLLQGRTCGVSCDGGRTRALQPSSRSAALHLIHPHSPITSKQPRFQVVASFRFVLQITWHCSDRSSVPHTPQ
ncbi:hypothetical protein E1J25_13085 [Xanthomonas hortorum pv. taraxaci]|nr:hypothetical protein [Xanthomonas hortorum pv. taraxaci]